MSLLLKLLLVGSILLNIVALWGFYHYVRYGGSPLGELKRMLTGTTQQAAPTIPYAQENALLKQQIADGTAAPNRVVFFGASITARWDLAAAFPGLNAQNRGVGNQLVPAMLARYKRDVLEIKPEAVLLKFCSINVRPFMPLSTMQDGMIMMVDLARAHGIQPIVCTIIPAGKPEARIGDFSVVDTLHNFNVWLRRYAADNALPMVDYAQAISDKDNFLPREYSVDPVHVNDAGYEILARTARPVIDSVLAARALTASAPTLRP